MAYRGESREDIRQALAGLGWDVRADEEENPGVVTGGCGKYHLVVSFEGGEPTSVLISYVGKGGEILSRKWPGVDSLPTPQKVVSAFS